MGATVMGESDRQDATGKSDRRERRAKATGESDGQEQQARLMEVPSWSEKCESSGRDVRGGVRDVR